MPPLQPDDPQTTHSTDDETVDTVLHEVAYAPPRRPPSAAAPGTRWGESGRYVIDGLLGRGGMGTVYAATDTLLGRVVALKVLDAVDADQDTAHYSRLLREAKLAASVEHERIARVYDVGRHEGFSFVAMEYVQGSTLREWRTGRSPTTAEILDVVTQVAEGLAELHAKGVIHRDLKPENVMLTAQGGVKLLDFGLARQSAIQEGIPVAQGQFATVDSASVAAAAGTPGYMAPEQCAGQHVDARADIFALGVIVYELIAGERPFHGGSAQSIMNATLSDIPMFSHGAWNHLPDRLRNDTARMLARDPDARFRNGASVLASLREVAVTMPGARTPLPAVTAQTLGRAETLRAPDLPRRHKRRLAWQAVKVTGMVVAVTAVTVVAFDSGSWAPWRTRRAPRPPPGMVLIDVRRIEVGRDLGEIEEECREIGAGCDRNQMLREVPRTAVTLGPFFIDRNEVANEDFVKMLNMYRGTLSVVEDEDYHYPRFVRRNAGTGGDGEVLVDLNARHGGIEYVRQVGYRARPGHERRPATQVTWYGAKLFCESYGKRLPTEDEWEGAARGGGDRPFPWGGAPVRCGDVAVPNDGKIRMPATCAAKMAERAVGLASQDVTPEGVHDLAGNVAEWTSSLFVEGDRAARPTTGPRDGPRVIRGGSWAESLMARSSGRNRRPPSIMGANLGFRCALSADEK